MRFATTLSVSDAGAGRGKGGTGPGVSQPDKASPKRKADVFVFRRISFSSIGKDVSPPQLDPGESKHQDRVLKSPANRVASSP